MLRIALPRVHLVMDMAEWYRFNSEPVSRLLTELKDAAYDTEDLLSEIEYNNYLWEQIRRGKDLTALPMLLVQNYTEKDTPTALFSHLEFVTTELEKMIKLLGKPPRLSAEFIGTPLETISRSLMMKSELFGRQEEKEMMIQRLLVLSASAGPEKGNFSTLAIVGNRGIGKTTLVKDVYHDKEIIVNFQLRVWISASKECSEHELIKDIVLSNTVITEEDFYEFDRKYDMINIAKRTMRSKRILIVLDDIQNGENLYHWNALCLSLRLGSKGTVILVTTQSKTVAEIMGTTDAIFLRGLSDDICWSFVNHCSFGNNEMGSDNLMDIGKQIAAKLEGSPLAAKILGSTLNQLKSADQWLQLLKSEIWQLRQEENHILPALVLSYLCLPMSLKQCFSLCSIFPKGCALPRELLISVWIADGIVAPQADAFMEDLGSKQFNELVSRFFIQGNLENPSLFVMHNLIHELSQTIYRNESISLDEAETSMASNSVRHLSVNKTEVDYEWISGCKKLRSLLFLNGHKYDLDPVIDRLINELKCLRMLYLSRCNLKELPKEIGNLKYLQHLDISYTEIRHFPPDFCKLYNLLVLDINHCAIEKFPGGFSQLSNLRIIRTSLAINTMIHNFGNLTSLENLSCFRVQKDHRMIDLKNMTRLRGSLAITELKNCRSVKHVAQACLSNKKHIVNLTLEWGQDAGCTMLVKHKVLEVLEPHPCLKMLKIKYYPGINYPAWLETKKWQYLSDIVIEGCSNLRSSDEYWLTPHRVPALKSLCVINCKELMSLPAENFYGFPHLECLEVRDCPELIHYKSTMSFPTSMKRIVIGSSQYIEEVVPSSLPFIFSLQCFVLLNSNYITFLPNKIMGELRSLEVLEICNCVNLRCIELQGLISLKNLSIRNCPLLIESVSQSNEKAECQGLPELSFLSIDSSCLIKLSGLKTPPCSLQTLTISNSPEHTAFDGESGWLQGLKSSLKKLIFIDCGNLRCLPKDIVGLISLEHLSISGCPELEHLPKKSLPPNLLFLRFNGTIVWPEDSEIIGTSTGKQQMNQFCEASSSQKNARKRQRGVEENNKRTRSGAREKEDNEME